jgi:hypothetical protein
VLRMVIGLNTVRFGELELTLDQDQKRSLDTMPKTMLEALELINEFKVKAPSSTQKPGAPFKAVFGLQFFLIRLTNFQRIYLDCCNSKGTANRKLR